MHPRDDTGEIESIAGGLPCRCGDLANDSSMLSNLAGRAGFRAASCSLQVANVQLVRRFVRRRRIPRRLTESMRTGIPDVCLVEIGVTSIARKLDQSVLDHIPPDLGAPRRPKPAGNASHGNRAGQHGIRINDQYRICFGWSAFRASAEVARRGGAGGSTQCLCGAWYWQWRLSKGGRTPDIAAIEEAFGRSACESRATARSSSCASPNVVDGGIHVLFGIHLPACTPRASWHARKLVGVNTERDGIRRAGPEVPLATRCGTWYRST